MIGEDGGHTIIIQILQIKNNHTNNVLYHLVRQEFTVPPHWLEEYVGGMTLLLPRVLMLVEKFVLKTWWTLVLSVANHISFWMLWDQSIVHCLSSE
uniref:Uncharacterized protein n=1 Tax=Lepeophtheirus salmonis TaxID=72036 RepID=A0A0K2V9W9_LEPSM